MDKNTKLINSWIEFEMDSLIKKASITEAFLEIVFIKIN